MAKTSEIIGWTALASAGVAFIFAGAYSFGVAMDDPPGAPKPPYRRAVDVADDVDVSAYARNLGLPPAAKPAPPPPAPALGGYAPLIASPAAWDPASAAARRPAASPPPPTPQLAAPNAAPPNPAAQITARQLATLPAAPPPVATPPVATPPVASPVAPSQAQPQAAVAPPPSDRTSERISRGAALVIAALPPPHKPPPPAPSLVPDLSAPPPELAVLPAVTPPAAPKPEAPPSVARAPSPAAPPPPRGGIAVSRGDLDLPTEAPSVGVVISVAERRLYHLRADGQVDSYPVAVGKTPSVIPLGATQITRKRRDPTWIPTPDMRRKKPNLPASVPPGPNNPMGRFAMDLGWPMYRIHGTNQPDSIGRAASSGCFRMLPKDVEQLFAAVEVGERVFVANGRLRKPGPATPPAAPPAAPIAKPPALEAAAPTPTSPPAPAAPAPAAKKPAAPVTEPAAVNSAA